jgi:hypothetical protein
MSQAEQLPLSMRQLRLRLRDLWLMLEQQKSEHQSPLKQLQQALCA